MKPALIIALLATVIVASLYGGYQAVRYVRVTFAARTAKLLREAE